MRIKFLCFPLPRKDPSDPCNLLRRAMLLDAEPPLKEEGKSLSEINRENCIKRPYSCYLLPSLDTEYDDDIEYCEEVLAQITRLEKKEIDSYLAGRRDFSSKINEHEVVMENYIFGECYEWPLSTFPLVHYKVALQGWRQFLDIPKSIDAELIIDLPEVQFC